MYNDGNQGGTACGANDIPTSDLLMVVWQQTHMRAAAMARLRIILECASGVPETPSPILTGVRVGGLLVGTVRISVCGRP